MPDAYAALSKIRNDSFTLYEANPRYIPPPDRFFIKGTEYCRRSTIQTAKTKERAKPSDCWKYGESIIEVSTRKERYYCWACEVKGRDQHLPILNGTRGGLDHMAQFHNMDANSLPIKKESDQSTIKFGELTSKRDFGAFKRLFLQWLIYCHIAIAMIENHYFRELVTYLNKGLGALLPYARSTVRGWILAEYQEQKAIVRKELAKALTNIHLSFDTWTSPNRLSILGVHGHYIDASGKRQRRLLAFRQIHGTHSGENIAAALIAILEDYEVPADRIGYFMSDNAKNNDRAVDLLLRQLQPELSMKQRKGRRLRCFGHTCNLIAKACLLGKGSSKRLSDIQSKLSKGAFEAVDSIWRAFGGLGRLHNIVRYVRSSPQRGEEFASIPGDDNWQQFDELEVSFYTIFLVKVLFEIFRKFGSSKIRKSWQNTAILLGCRSYPSAKPLLLNFKILKTPSPIFKLC